MYKLLAVRCRQKVIVVTSIVSKVYIYIYMRQSSATLDR